METINTIELSNPDVCPDDYILEQILGTGFLPYKEMLSLFDLYRMDMQWRYYKDGKAWLCKVQNRKRTIVWMSAWKNYMQVTVYIPGKYIEQIYNLPLTEECKERIRKTINIGTSKPCIFNVTDFHVLKDLEILIRFKIASR